MASRFALNLSTPTPNPSPQGGGGLRRGACPGLSAPMPTGDGLLVRLMPVGTMPLRSFVGLCAAASEHGNGIIEITARGSVQVRGLSSLSAPRFAAAVAALGIAAADGVPIQSNPLAGLDPEEMIDASALAADLRRALVRTSLGQRLAPKVSVTIDGGGALSLDGIAADVRLDADRVNGRTVLRVGVADDGEGATSLGAVAPAGGVEAAIRLLEVIARHGRDARARDVLAGTAGASFRFAIADLIIADVPPRRPTTSRDAIGLFDLRDGSLACGVGLAFGHAEARSLELLAETARQFGAKGLRTAPGRVLVIVGLPREAAIGFAVEAERLGFVVRADDPRRAVVACAGAPICASAHIPARRLAPLVAEAAAGYLNAAFKVHISGCAKGCAHANAAALTIVGSSDGCALVADGTARDAPFAVTAADEIPAAVARYARIRRGAGRG